VSRAIRQLGKHSLTFGVGDALKGLIGFLLIPLYTRYLSPADYGTLALITVILSIFSSLACQGQTSAFFRFYAFREKEQRDLKELISTSHAYLLFSSSIATLLLIAFANEISFFLQGEKGDPKLIVIGAVIVFSQVMGTIPYAFIRAKLESVKYITIALVQFTLQCSLNIVFLVFLGFGVDGVLLGNAISTGLVAIVISIMLATHFTRKLSMSLLKDLLSFGWPIVFVGMSNWVMNITDRLLLEKLGTTHELGLYSLGSSFANIMLILFVMPFRKVWGAYLFQVATHDDAKESFRDIASYFFLLICFAGAMVVIWIEPVIRIVAGKDFWDAADVVPVLVLANVFSAMVLMFTIGMHIQKKTRVLSYITGVGAASNIILNIVLIPLYGMIGAALASLISYLVIDLLAYRKSQSLYRVPYEASRFVKILVVFSLVAFAASALQFDNLLLDIGFRGALMIAFFLGLNFVGFWRESEVAKAKQVFLRIRSAKGFNGKVRVLGEMMRG
jgi:O-antigen/teichoic acid export membrane protein